MIHFEIKKSDGLVVIAHSLLEAAVVSEVHGADSFELVEKDGAQSARVVIQRRDVRSDY